MPLLSNKVVNEPRYFYKVIVIPDFFLRFYVVYYVLINYSVDKNTQYMLQLNTWLTYNGQVNLGPIPEQPDANVGKCCLNF